MGQHSAICLPLTQKFMRPRGHLMFYNTLRGLILLHGDRTQVSISCASDRVPWSARAHQWLTPTTGSHREISPPLCPYHSSRIPSYLYQKQESLLNMVLFGTIKCHILIWKSSVHFSTPEAPVSSCSLISLVPSTVAGVPLKVYLWWTQRWAQADRARDVEGVASQRKCQLKRGGGSSHCWGALTLQGNPAS